MSVNEKRRMLFSDPEVLKGLALQPLQISSTLDPTMPIQALLELGSTLRSERACNARHEPVVGRPYFLWGDDPDLARQLNDALADRRVN